MLDEKDLNGPATDTRVWADDVNGDGKLDLLVGDSVNLVSMAEGLSREEFEAKQSEWERAWERLLSEALSKARAAAENETEPEPPGDEISEHYEKRSEFLREERTGFVWLYLGR